MDPHFLLKDELEFELASRGYVQPSGLVSALKLVLKKILIVESSQKVSYKIKPTASCIDHPDEELEICSNKLDTILRYVSELNEKPDKNLYKRLVSRLSHVVNRLRLIKAVEQVDIEKQQVLTDKAVVLLSELERKDDLEDNEMITPEMKDALHRSFGEDSKKILNEIENNVFVDAVVPSTSTRAADVANGVTGHTPKPNLEHKRVSFAQEDFDIQAFHERLPHANVFNSTTVHENQSRKNKLVPISQWGVQFLGDSSYSVNAFIERVNELKEARNATDDDLYRHAIDFFKGDALIWFRANREYVSDWCELVLLLKRTFQSPFYQEELLSEAKSRTQGHNESVLIFISVMQNLFNRLPNKISEYEKIMIITKNLQPYYQRAVCRDVFTSISDLVNVLRVIERTKINCDRFQEPKTLVNSIEPDLAYRSNESSQATENLNEMKNSNTSNTPKMRCWNCRETGHLFRLCSMPKQRLFCYKCGRFGVTSKDCSCKGNAAGERQDPAN